MNKKNDSGLKDWAYFRFSVIGGLLARPPDKGQLKKQLEELAQKRWRHPITGQWAQFGVSTIERWYYKALNSQDPVDALGRKLRSDAGISTVMTGLLIDKLAEQYAFFPHFSFKLHADNLAALINEKPRLGKTPSYATGCGIWIFIMPVDGLSTVPAGGTHRWRCAFWMILAACAAISSGI